MTKRTAILLVLFAALTAAEARAQVSGTISGYVRDESGAVIPGADVRATMVGQQLTRSAVSDETGFFNLLAMPRGNYEITAQLTGFATQSTKAELTSGENLRVDFRMNLGQIQETVVVAGTAALVETRSATMSGLVDDRRVQELPLNGRNVVELAATLPGITDVSASQEMASTRGGPTMIVHGASRGQNNFTLNGANFTNYSQTSGFNPPPPDAVQEIRVQTSTFSAEFGNNAGAQVTMVTKAGSNQFHGSAWEFHRNDALNARNYFAPRKSDQEQNQWGAAGGGRIVPNKLFFFGAYQKLTNRAEAVGQQATVPTDAQRAGDFRSLATQLRTPVNPLNNQPYTNAAGAPCVSGNVIDPGCISPVAKNYLDQYIPRSATGTAVKLIPSPLDAYNFITRVDYTVSSKNTLFGHYFKDNYERISSPGNIDYVDESNVADVNNYGLTNTHTFSSTFLNELTVSYMDSSSFRTATERVPPRDMGINIDEGYLGVGMSLNVTGGPNLSFTGPERQVYRNWHWKDVMTMVRSAHTFKWGYEGQSVNFDLIRGNGARNATFTGTRSGNSMADFMLGAFDNVSHGFGAADSFPLLWKHQFFIQDEWKLTPRITMNAGLRYEPWFPWEQEYGRYTSWEYRTQSTVKPDAPRGILFPGDPGVPDKTIEGDWNNWAPRVGVAWDVNGSGRTVIRSGYGIYYNHIAGTSVHAAEAPWTAHRPALQRPHRRSVRLAEPDAAAFGCANLGRLRLRANHRISWLELPALPAAAELRLQRSRDGDALRASFQRLVPAPAGHQYRRRCRLRRPVRQEAGRPSSLQPGAVHQLAAHRRSAVDAEHQRPRHLRARHHRPDLTRARDDLRELVPRSRTQGHQTDERRVHVLDVLYALEGDRHAARPGCRVDGGRGEPVRPDRDEGTFAVRSAACARAVVDVGTERRVWQRRRQCAAGRVDRERRAQLDQRQPR